MFAQFFSLILVNTYSWMGGQGYCAYDFALRETEAQYVNVEIVMRPLFDPQKTATGLTALDDVTINLEMIGDTPPNWDATAKVETDCTVAVFDIVSALATENGQPVDLVKTGKIGIERYEPLSITIGRTKGP